MNKAYRPNPPVQVARTDLKLREVLLKNSTGIFDGIRISVGVGPSGVTIIPKAERTVQGNLPFHGPVQVAQTDLKIRSFPKE